MGCTGSGGGGLSCKPASSIIAIICDTPKSSFGSVSFGFRCLTGPGLMTEGDVVIGEIGEPTAVRYPDVSVMTEATDSWRRCGATGAWSGCCC